MKKIYSNSYIRKLSALLLSFFLLCSTTTYCAPAYHLTPSDFLQVPLYTSAENTALASNLFVRGKILEIITARGLGQGVYPSGNIVIMPPNNERRVILRFPEQRTSDETAVIPMTVVGSKALKRHRYQAVVAADGTDIKIIDLLENNIIEDTVPGFSKVKNAAREIPAQEKRDRISELLPPEEYFGQDWEKLILNVPSETTILAVNADHSDPDSNVSVLTMSYYFYILMNLTGHENILVVPVLNKKFDAMDGASKFILAKCLSEKISLNIPSLSDPLSGLIEQHKKLQVVQVDSNGGIMFGTEKRYAIIDHHKMSIKNLPEGSHIEKGPSAAFYIYQEFMDCDIPVLPEIAKLIVYAVLSDTLNFSVNTDSSQDIQRKIAHLVANMKDGSATVNLADMFNEFSSVAYPSDNLSIDAMLADRKGTYFPDAMVSQINFNKNVGMVLNNTSAISEEIKKILPPDKKAWIFIATDIFGRVSYVFVEGTDEGTVDKYVSAIEKAGMYPAENIEGTRIFTGTKLLRKQIVADITDALESPGKMPGRNTLTFSLEDICQIAHTTFTEPGWDDRLFDLYLEMSATGGAAVTDTFSHALMSMMYDSNEEIRKGAARIMSRPSFLGPVNDKRLETERSDRSIYGILTGSIPDADNIVADFYLTRTERMRAMLYAQLLSVLMWSDDRQTVESALKVLNKLEPVVMFTTDQMRVKLRRTIHRQMKEEAGDFMGDFSEPEILVKSMLSSMESCLFSGRKLMICLETGDPGSGAIRNMDEYTHRLRAALGVWKKHIARNFPGMKYALENLEIITFKDTGGLTSSLNARKDKNDDDLIFVFAGSTGDPVRDKNFSDHMQALTGEVKTVLIQEEQDMSGYYYPITEILLLSLSEALLGNDMEFLLEVCFDELKMDVRDLNISRVQPLGDDDACTVFHILPNAEKLDMESGRARFERIISFLRHA